MTGEVSRVIQLSTGDLAIASGLVVAVGVASLLLRLRVERQLAVAAVRTVVQLVLIGYVLRWVFNLNSPAPVGALALVMVVIATWAAIRRSARTFAGVWWRAFAALFVTALATTLVATQVVIGVRPWYEPQYLIPLLGMLLGNSLTGVSLCLDQLLETLAERRDEIEMELAHGASRWEAARDRLAEAVRRGMIPIINTMMVVGLVSLPGMMTGQILAGEDPLSAVKYQILIMFMIAAAVAITSMIMVVLAYRRFFTEDHRLDIGPIRKR